MISVNPASNVFFTSSDKPNTNELSWKVWKIVKKILIFLFLVFTCTKIDFRTKKIETFEKSVFKDLINRLKNVDDTSPTLKGINFSDKTTISKMMPILKLVTDHMASLKFASHKTKLRHCTHEIIIKDDTLFFSLHAPSSSMNKNLIPIFWDPTDPFMKNRNWTIETVQPSLGTEEQKRLTCQFEYSLGMLLNLHSNELELKYQLRKTQKASRVNLNVIADIKGMSEKNRRAVEAVIVHKAGKVFLQTQYTRLEEEIRAIELPFQKV